MCVSTSVYIYGGRGGRFLFARPSLDIKHREINTNIPALTELLRSTAHINKVLLLLLLSRFSHVQLCATPQMAAHQAPQSLGFSRQEHWSGLPFPSPMHEGENWKWSCSVVSDSLRPHGLQPTRLLHPWDFPGKSTGVGCHCLLRNKVLNKHKE